MAATEVPALLKANILGDVRAEADARMLDVAFYESADYRSLIESTDRGIVVGRRGTGKSALLYALGRHFAKQENVFTISVAPEEDEIYGLRAAGEVFGSKFRLVRAGMRVAWRYALSMEIGQRMRLKYKPKSAEKYEELRPYLEAWKNAGDRIGDRLRVTLERNVDPARSPEANIGDLATKLRLRDVEDNINSLFDSTYSRCVLMLDRLDEGYEPDDTGIGLVDGLLHATADAASRIEHMHAIVFLRDNMFRAVSQSDPDFSRNIEGRTLRLHWDEYALLNLTANRLRAAFGDEEEQSIKVWDRHVADGPDGLRGKDGFRHCLRLTLYRPRDLLLLLNNAFLHAGSHCRDRLTAEDVDSSAKTISINRLDDLRKEYSAIVPTLRALTSAFAGQGPELSLEEAEALVKQARADTSRDILAQQHFAIVGAYRDSLRELYSVGFIGINSTGSGDFVYCHDGRNPTREFAPSTRFLIHPCYWLALGIGPRELNPDFAQEIYDEYEIEVSSETPQRRSADIGALIAQLGNISLGKDGWRDFEDWAYRALQIVFAGRLANLEMHPNGRALQQRDIIGTNLAETSFWRRVVEDYGTRQVVFEIKNYEDLQPDDFRQVLSYSGREYGRCAFIISRANDDNLRKGTELDWVRELYSRNQILCMRISAKRLAALLSKLRSPQKHDVGDKYFQGLMDQYIRMYVDMGRSSR